MGVVPADTKLTPRPKEIPAWADMNEQQRKLFERHMETFAGFAECQQVVIIVVDLAPHDPCGLRIVRCGHLSSKHLDGWYGLT